MFMFPLYKLCVRTHFGQQMFIYLFYLCSLNVEQHNHIKLGVKWTTIV